MTMHPRTHDESEVSMFLYNPAAFAHAVDEALLNSDELQSIIIRDVPATVAQMAEPVAQLAERLAACPAPKARYHGRLLAEEYVNYATGEARTCGMLIGVAYEQLRQGLIQWRGAFERDHNTSDTSFIKKIEELEAKYFSDDTSPLPLPESEAAD